ncbi:MAG: RHS repeat-associated core domain-containing protein, partial [Defluviitaleaceae bacterium]|nr:RHS repeat-associated core domain-containing protein [Defluviitaleaceae bacterium]
DGLRHGKTVNGFTTTHVWNGSNIVLERNHHGGVVNRFERSRSGRLIRSLHHGWYIHNIRGDVVQRVDNGGGILHTYQYSAFGVEQSPDENNTNPFRFAGEYYDWETGTYYLRARHFNPRTGRFSQPDPFWNVHNMQNGAIGGRNPNSWTIMQSANLYVFTLNDPVNFIDPSGLFAIPAIPLAVLLALAAAGTGAIAYYSTNVAPVLIASTSSSSSSNRSTGSSSSGSSSRSTASSSSGNSTASSPSIDSGLTDGVPNVSSRTTSGVTNPQSRIDDDLNLNDVNPSNLPPGWTSATHNGHTHIRDENGRIRVRIDPPDRVTNYPHRHHQDASGRALDADGQYVNPRSPEAHIRLEI